MQGHVINRKSANKKKKKTENEYITINASKYATRQLR